MSRIAPHILQRGLRDHFTPDERSHILDAIALAIDDARDHAEELQELVDLYDDPSSNTAVTTAYFYARQQQTALRKKAAFESILTKLDALL